MQFKVTINYTNGDTDYRIIDAAELAFNGYDVWMHSTGATVQSITIECLSN
jgi:hypothetical protein